jgi:hypothetical protein
MNESQKFLRNIIVDVIENQIRDNDPPDTKITLDRLLKEGFSQEEAINMISTVLASQVSEILKSGKPFDRKRYARELAVLPHIKGEE